MSAASPKIPDSKFQDKAADKAHEPSMEEILASIRRIIADDQAAKPAEAPVAAPEPDDVLDLAEVAEPVTRPRVVEPEPEPEPAYVEPDAIVERGRVGDRAYVLFGDGSVEVETLLGVRRFASIDEARDFILRAWWTVTFPGLAILLTVLAINLVGDGLRDALDPRLKRS